MDDQKKYLSLKTAAGLYGYTRDHLGLMIRLGKLNGIKLGNYYVTTGDWMDEYVKKFANLNHPTLKNKLSNKFLFRVHSANKSPIVKKPPRFNDNADDGNVNFIPRSQDIAGNDFKDDLQEKLSEELSNLSTRYGIETVAAQNTGSGIKTGFSSGVISGNPYVILPIRRMEIGEKEEILKRIEKNI